MSFSVRDGSFDVAVIAGPRVEFWPSAGARAVAKLCADAGLSVGVFGGETLAVRGVIPLPGMGGMVLIEDVQHRIHRIRARAVVKVSPSPQLPDPFPGWRSEALIPISTAERLRARGQVAWNPTTVVLGTGNRAFKFASSLLEGGVSEVYAIETHSQWGAKRFAGWEVERRRFEMLGGRLIEAKPLKLSRKAALLWEFRVTDAQGVRVIETARVVSAGPFGEISGIREHPPGSFLFELEQTALANRPDDVEGWTLEEERGRWLAAKIAKALIVDLGAKREIVDRAYGRARTRLKRAFRHREAPFTPAYQGKFIASADLRGMRAFEGMPKQAQLTRPVAALECFEDISCDLCHRACPTGAIELAGRHLSLKEGLCTACGLCLPACPSGSTLMMRENTERSHSELTLSWRGKRAFQVGEFATLLNRRGEALGTGRVTKLPAPGVVQVEVPSHLVLEARALRAPRSSSATDEVFLEAQARPVDERARVEVTLNGERRLVDPNAMAIDTLFETGHERPEDTLHCADGSCHLCEIIIDGAKRLACQTPMRKGINVKSQSPVQPKPGAQPEKDDLLCPCLGISLEEVALRLKQGKLRSPEAVLSVAHVGEGKCHGQLCLSAFRRALIAEGIDASQWVDWRFPWTEWTLIKG